MRHQEQVLGTQDTNSHGRAYRECKKEWVLSSAYAASLLNANPCSDQQAQEGGRLLVLGQDCSREMATT